MDATNPNANVIIGSMVRAARRAQKASQKRLAAVMRITQGHLSRLERGEREWNMTMLDAAARELGLRVADFAGAFSLTRQRTRAHGQNSTSAAHPASSNGEAPEALCIGS